MPIVKELKEKVDNIYSKVDFLIKSEANGLDEVRNKLQELYEEISKLTDDGEDHLLKDQLDKTVEKIIGSETEQTDFAEKLNEKYQELQEKVQEFIELAKKALEKSQNS